MLIKYLLVLLLSFGSQAQDLQNPFSLDDESTSKSSPSEPSQKPTASETVAPTVEPAEAAQETTAPEEDALGQEKLEPTIPRLTSPVVDQAGVLDRSQASQLERKIRDIHKQGGPQLQILIVNNLGGFAIEEYSIALGEAWKIGRKEKGDGVIILMSKEDREVRIEVGQGAEGDLTDVESHQIVQYTMVPKFKQGDFFGGFEAAVDTVAGEFGIKAYQGRDLSPPKDLAKIRRSKEQMASLILPLIIFFVTFPIITRFLGKSPIIKSVVGATYMGALTFFLVGQLFFIILAVIFGLFIGLIGPLNFLMVMLSQSGRGGYGRGGGFGGGGGGWSGGGGGFSGGGASGRW